MSSSRLPKKVLLPLAGRPVLQHIVERLNHSKIIDQIIVATSTDHSDDPIEVWCQKAEVPFFRGELLDVLDRYYRAATEYEANPIVRITADCPAIDPVIVDEVINGYLSGEYDGYSLAGEFPKGLDCQVFSYPALEKAWKEAKLLYDREHVGPYIENNPHLFNTGKHFRFKDLSKHRWTLDEPEDYEFLKIIFDRLYRDGYIFYHNDILRLLEKEPHLLKINSKFIRNHKSLNYIYKDTL